MKELMSVGIDISKDEFNVCVKEQTPNAEVKIKGSRKFANTHNGFTEFKFWISKRSDGKKTVHYIMEATGSYYEDLAYFLHETGSNVFVVLANKVKHFAKSLNLKTKTDKVDASLIAAMGLQHDLQEWHPMAPEYKHLRDLCRERLSLKKERSRALCQLHAMNHSHEVADSVMAIKKSQIVFYDAAILQLETEITKIVDSDAELRLKVQKIEKIKGLRTISIVTVLCETNGFHSFNNIRQVVSYAGLDVVMKESGQYKGRTRISKKGNSRIRQCLFMPALSATNHNQNIKKLYERVVERNPGIKRKGVVAGMRKLLILIFVLWKKDEDYNPAHTWQPSKDIG